VDAEAPQVHSGLAKERLCSAPCAANDLAAGRRPGMVAFILPLVEGHGLSSSCLPETTPAMPLLFLALMLYEAQRNKINRAGREGLEKRRRFTASAAAYGWGVGRSDATEA